MTNLVTLTRVRMQLAMRNKMFFFFSVIMPLAFFFLYAGIFAKGDPKGVLFVLGPVLALSVMGSFWGLSAALVTFREQGILRRFHVTPVSATEMLVSSALANFVLTLPTIAVVLLLSRLIFHVHSFGNLPAAFLFICVGTLAFGALGLVVASVTNTMQETQVINQLIWFPLIFLSGATIPLSALPKIVQGVGVFLPATYLVTALQQTLSLSKSLSSQLVYLLVLIVWAVLSLFVAVQLFRWEPEAKIPRKAKLWALATVIPFILLGIWEHGNGKLLTEARAAYDAVNQPDQPPAQSPPQN